MARNQTEKIVLVGHSLGGIIITEAAELAPEVVACVIFVTALLMPDGASASDVLNLEALSKGLGLSEDGALILINDPDFARTRYYNGFNNADIEDALARLVPQPTSPIRDRLTFRLNGLVELRALILNACTIMPRHSNFSVHFRRRCLVTRHFQWKRSFAVFTIAKGIRRAPHRSDR